MLNEHFINWIRNIGKIHLRNFLKFNDLNIYIYDTKSEVVNELVGPRSTFN